MIVKLSQILNVEMRPDLLGSVVVLLSQRFVFQVVETVDGRQSSLVEFGSVSHVSVRVYAFRKNHVVVPQVFGGFDEIFFTTLKQQRYQFFQGRRQELVIIIIIIRMNVIATL